MPESIAYLENRARNYLSHRMPLLTRATEAGFDVTLLAPDPDGAFKELRGRGFTCREVSLDRESLGMLKEGASLRSIRSHVEATDPDLVHNSTLKPIMYGSIASLISGPGTVVNTFTGLGKVYNSGEAKYRVVRGVYDRLLLNVLRFQDCATVFQHDSDRSRLEDRGAVPKESTVTVPGGLGVDTETFVSRRPPTSDAPMVVLPARLTRQKGVPEYVAAARKLKGRMPDARFVVVGDPDPASTDPISADKLRSWEDEGAIEWWGYREDMVTVMNEADIVCLPSIRGEGTPRTLLEAASCSRPVVTSDVAGCKDFVTDTSNGLVVPAGDVEALARALQTLLEDPARREELGATGRRVAEKRYDIDVVTDQLMGLYRDLLS